MTDRIVILGAGGLSLGFFGPEFRSQYDLTFVDTHYKADLVDEIRRRHAYTTNLAGDTVEPVTIEEVDAFRLDIPDHDAELRKHIEQARIFFTAVGIRNLDSALSYLAERLRGRTDAVYILCAENGENVADQWREKLPGNIHICETVMGRMCRIEENASPRYEAVAPGLSWGVVGEAFYGIPVSNRNYDPEVFHSDVFQFVSDEEFHARERVKLYAHNGLHFFIAAYGRLRGADRFSDLADDAELVTSAHAILEGEIAPALWKDCATAIGKSAFDDYIHRLPGRLLSRTLCDQIARGTRGILDKFAPNERVLGGLRLLLDNGVAPARYYDLIAHGLEVVRRDVSADAAQELLSQLPDEDTRREVRNRWKTLA